MVQHVKSETISAPNVKNVTNVKNVQSVTILKVKQMYRM